jgi:Na+/H+ antiporter NhaC
MAGEGDRQVWRGHKSRRAGEASIAALSATADVFTANNTEAILISGGLTRDIAQEHGVPPARVASVLDIFACVTQGLLQYGAQILLAASTGQGLALGAGRQCALRLAAWCSGDWLHAVAIAAAA